MSEESEKQRLRSQELRHIATGALVLWAFIATIGVISLAIQSVHTTDALHKAAAANGRAEAAIGRSIASIASSQKALAGVQKQEERLRTQLVQGCIRLNIARSTANAAFNGVFSIDSLFLRAIRTAPVPRHQTKRQKALTREFLKSERNSLSSIKWTQLTDCQAAVAQAGAAYKAPFPIAFLKKLPPKSATDPRNARLPTPVGSVP